MAKVMWKPGTFLYPLPAVMVSCGTMEKSNIITVAWTGIINTNPPMVYISLRPSRYSYELIKKQGEFLNYINNIYLDFFNIYLIISAIIGIAMVILSELPQAVRENAAVITRTEISKSEMIFFIAINSFSVQSISFNCVKATLQICENVINVFCTNRQTDGIWFDSLI